METCSVGLPGFNSLFQGCRKPGTTLTFRSQALARSIRSRTSSRRTRRPYQRRGDGRANESLRNKHARTIPITANLVAVIFVSLSDRAQDQRQALTSLMAHRNRVLADYRLNELPEVYLEIFCTTKTSADNPPLARSGKVGQSLDFTWRYRE